MATRQRKHETTSRKRVKENTGPSNNINNKNVAHASISYPTKDTHFVPTFLLLTVLICSGFIAILAYRDMFGTGKVIFGEDDAAMLYFTRSTQWFDDSRGWKSTQGGFSAVHQITTDQNDMGGLFVRKLLGAAALGYHLQKLIPLLFQRYYCHWGHGHFKPLLVTSALSNLSIAAYYLSNIEILKSADAHTMGLKITFALVIEALVMMAYILTSSFSKGFKSTKAKPLPVGKGPNSLVSKILTRTILIVTSFITLIAGRDFFFPGQEMPFPPFDDIYLEWTGAFIHSPPHGSVEAEEYGMEALLHVGDKFVARLTALYVLVVCFQKYVAAFLIRVGSDNSGETKCSIFWQSQAISDGLLIFVFRVFAPAAKSASLDFRWHVMCLGYECFMLAIYGYY